jgi:hypothetical protein
VPSVAEIELDVSEPWEPPERPPPRVQFRRAGAAVVVAVLTLVALVADRPTASFAPLYRIGGDGLQSYQADAHTIYVTRKADAGTAVEAYRLGDGRLLWSVRRPGLAMVAAFGDGRVILSEPELESPRLDFSVLTGLDAADGREVWRRSSIGLLHFDGSAHDVWLIEGYVTDGDADVATDRPLEGIDAPGRRGAGRRRHPRPAQ